MDCSLVCSRTGTLRLNMDAKSFATLLQQLPNDCSHRYGRKITSSASEGRLDYDHPTAQTTFVFQPHITCSCRNGTHHTGNGRYYRLHYPLLVSYLTTHTSVVPPVMMRRAIVIFLPRLGQYVWHELRKSYFRISISGLAWSGG